MTEKLESKPQKCDYEVICQELCGILTDINKLNGDFSQCPVYREYMSRDFERDKLMREIDLGHYLFVKSN